MFIAAFFRCEAFGRGENAVCNAQPLWHERGAAVSAAMGFSPLAVSTDGAGSGRIPAACYGIVGLKPTIGAVLHETNSDLFGSLSRPINLMNIATASSVSFSPSLITCATIRV